MELHCTGRCEKSWEVFIDRTDNSCKREAMEMVIKTKNTTKSYMAMIIASSRTSEITKKLKKMKTKNKPTMKTEGRDSY